MKQLCLTQAVAGFVGVCMSGLIWPCMHAQRMQAYLVFVGGLAVAGGLAAVCSAVGAL